MAVASETVEEAWRRLARGEYQKAAEISRRLLATNPDDVSALCCHAMSTWQLGADIQQCIAQMRRAVAMAPEASSLWHNLGTVLASNGELGEACQSFATAIRLNPLDTEAFYGLSQNQKFGEEDALVHQMLELYSGGTLSQQAQEFVCFGLAKVYSDLNKPRRAIHFCIEANWLAHRAYDAEKPRADLAELRRLTAAGSLRHVAAGAEPTRAPVFIVGMPRSGTTLVETVLARHPEVHAGGEMLHMFNVEQALLNWARQNKGYEGGPYDMLKLVPPDYFTRNARAVLNHVEAAAGRPFSVFTDKLPDNTQRLGLISKVFPGARIIYVRRNALDCCISNLFQRFSLGHGFSFRQDLLGERYRQVAETMQLWKQSVTLPIMDVSYEALVTDPEPVIRKIVAFAGLEWDDACLSPQLASRRIMTASQYQVKQPINRNSVDRWRSYRDWIQPLINSLGGLDWIEAEQREVSALVA